MLRRMLRAAGLAMLLFAGAAPALAQDVAPAAPRQAVTVVPEASDTKIAGRLQRILTSTGWFQATRVSVHDGVVFLDGTTGTQEHRAWAGTLAENTQGTVAVVNRIEADADVGSTFARAGAGIHELLPAGGAGLAAGGACRPHRPRHMADRQTVGAGGSAAVRGPHRVPAAAVGGGAGVCDSRVSAGRLFRAAILRADAAGHHGAWRHRADRHHHRLRPARHCREFSGERSAQRAQSLPQRRSDRCRRAHRRGPEPECAQHRAAHARRQSGADPQLHRLQEHHQELQQHSQPPRRVHGRHRLRFLGRQGADPDRGGVAGSIPPCWRRPSRWCWWRSWVRQR